VQQTNAMSVSRVRPFSMYVCHAYFLT